LVADGAASAGDEAAGARAGTAVAADADAAGGAAEATDGDAARRVAAAIGVFFLATGFFGGFTACRVT
jgi:hypothetical protein